MYKQLRKNPLQKKSKKQTSTHLMCATQVLISFRIHIFLYERIIRLLPCQTIKQISMQKNEQKNKKKSYDMIPSISSTKANSS